MTGPSKASPTSQVGYDAIAANDPPDPHLDAGTLRVPERFRGPYTNARTR